MLLQIPTANLNPNELSFSPSFLTAPIIFSVPDRHSLVRTSLKVKVWCCPINLDNWLSVNNCLLWPNCGIIAGEGSWNEKAVEGNSLSTVQAQAAQQKDRLPLQVHVSVLGKMKTLLEIKLVANFISLLIFPFFLKSPVSHVSWLSCIHSKGHG